MRFDLHDDAKGGTQVDITLGRGKSARKLRVLACAEHTEQAAAKMTEFRDAV